MESGALQTWWKTLEPFATDVAGRRWEMKALAIHRENGYSDKWQSQDVEESNTGGGLRKIGDLPKICRHPEHHPPSMIVLPDGVYEYTCPGCGARQRFIVSSPTI
jgi:hypothetical protein